MQGLRFITCTEGEYHYTNKNNLNNYSWNRSCPDLQTAIANSVTVDNSKGVNGYLELVGAATGFDYRYRIPGSTMKYKCSNGFDIGDGTNPEQLLICSFDRKVSFGNVQKCQRKISTKIHNV